MLRWTARATVVNGRRLLALSLWVAGDTLHSRRVFALGDRAMPACDKAWQ